MKFEIGNKVRVIENKRHGHPIGTIGIVKDLEKSPSKYVLVEDINKTYNLWHEEDELELYVEKQESKIMKNLLETEFVIENCKLSQRLAIKAYCDEKKISYYQGGFDGEDIDGFPHMSWNKEKFVATRVLKKKITFSELIQFLDQYQPEPEFKVGDHVIFFNETYKDICVLAEECTDGFIDTKKEFRQTEKKGLYRHATPEEIKKWKEENEIKLPKIADYSGIHTIGETGANVLKWGCTEISITTIKELLELGLDHITIKGYHVVDSEIQQIKKFIEHHKL